jgi:CubicO group peptidase (beta-lactamase class C family)
LNVKHVEVEGRQVRLLGRHTTDAAGIPAADSGDTETVIAEGSLDLEHQLLLFQFADHGGRFEFRHVTEPDDDGFHPRGRAPAKYSYTPPEVGDDAWPVATLDEVGIDHDTIVRFVQMLIETPIDSVHAPEIHGVLIARHGKLVLEEYFHGFSRGNLHDTRSAAKSLASVLTGAAIRQGAPISLSTAVYDTMDDLAAQIDPDPWKRALTVEHLLTMASGLDSDDWDPSSPGSEERMQTQTGQPDWHRFALELDMVRTPGEQAAYSAATCNLLGGVLARATGRWLPALFHDLIAEPLDIGHYAMNLMPSGEAYLGGGVRFRPRDFMKFGQLMLDGGGWRGRQIVDRNWAQQSITKRYGLNHISYGFLWWITEYAHQGRTVLAFFAGGNGGQVVMGLPELDLVIAFYGGNYSDRATYLAQRVYVPEHILPAIMQ